MIGCCFRGLYRGLMIYVRQPSNYGWVLGIQTRKKTPCPVLVVFPMPWLVK